MLQMLKLTEVAELFRTALSVSLFLFCFPPSYFPWNRWFLSFYHTRIAAGDQGEKDWLRSVQSSLMMRVSGKVSIVLICFYCFYHFFNNVFDVGQWIQEEGEGKEEGEGEKAEGEGEGEGEKAEGEGEGEKKEGQAVNGRSFSGICRISIGPART